MKPIANWDNVSDNFNSFKKLTTGGKICAIKSVVDYPDKQYLRIEYDIVRGEERGFYTKRYESDTRPNKKWGGFFIRSYKDSAAAMFKGFITAIEKSNPKFKWNWDEQSLVKKLFGAVIAEEEFIGSTGRKSVRTYIAQIHSTQTIEAGDFVVPELKKINPELEVRHEAPDSSDLDKMFGTIDNEEDKKSETPDLNLIGFDDEDDDDEDDDDDPFK